VDDRSTYPPSLLTFLLGSLAGASLALLFAPQSGRETRQTMSRRVRDGVDAARDLSQRVVHRGRELGDEASRRMSDAIETAERRADRAASALRDETL
jgi:gas vesicle protein